MGTVATSKYRPAPRPHDSRAATRGHRDPRPTLVQFVVLSMCLHALAILLFGAPRGGSREGRAMWGALEVELDRSYREAMPALRIDRALDALRAAPEKPRAPVRTRARPKREPPVRLDAAKELAAPTPAPPTPAPPTPAPPAAALATPLPAARPELVVPPMLERLAPAPRLEKLETFTVPPPTGNPVVAPIAPEAVPAPIEMQAMPRIEAAPLPSMAAPPRLEALPPPAPREPLAPMPPIATPALPALAPVERARIEAPVAKPVEAQPLEAPVAKPVEVQPLEAPVAKPVEAQPLEAPVAKPEAAKPVEVPPAVEAPAVPSVPATREVPLTRPVPMQAPAARTPSMPAAASPDGALVEPPSRFRTPAAPAATAGADYDPTTPQRPLDLDAMRMRAGQLAREGAGNRALLAFPLPPVPKEKSKLEKGIEKAWKPDCKTAYSSLGLAAVVPLIANEFGEGNCRW